MLGRKTFTREELDSARSAMDEQLAAYRDLNGAAGLETFEPLCFNNLTLALDRRFVHRLRGVTGKDGNPLNEVELIAESLMNNGGVLRGNTVVQYVPEESVLGLQIGDPIRIGADDFERLCNAFLADLEAKYVQ
jgi:hypothetical protein